jgi:hypothetical protein
MRSLPTALTAAITANGKEGTMAKQTKKRWTVVCDDVVEHYRTRDQARRAQRWHNNHPANADIRNHGPYLDADGIARIIDRWDDCDSEADDEAGYPWWRVAR